MRCYVELTMIHYDIDFEGIPIRKIIGCERVTPVFDDRRTLLDYVHKHAVPLTHSLTICEPIDGIKYYLEIKTDIVEEGGIIE